VKPSCAVSAATIDFPSYDPIADAGRTASTSLSIVCTKNHSATIGLSDGANFDAAAGRRMVSGTNFLAYELYQDASYSDRFGSAVGERLVYLGKGKVADSSVVVYAVIGAGQDTAAGTYTDSVVIDIAF
jgi:spore coat protein U-like protein